MDPYMKRLLEPLGVECVDAREIENQHPCRILCGWELKRFATLHSPLPKFSFWMLTMESCVILLICSTARVCL